MGFFDDDPFESIVEEFFGRTRPSFARRKEQFISGEDEERVIDFVETDDKVYLIFETPGYTENDVSVVASGNHIEIKAQKKNFDNVKEYLAQKLSHGLHYKRVLPNFISSKKFDYSVKNGILEIIFEKKK